MTNKFTINGASVQEHDRGASSILGTQRLRSQLPKLFLGYNINSMFDAGCADGVWQHLLCEFVEYHGGEINSNMVKSANTLYPRLDIKEFDILADDIPSVDVLFVRDVSIHFSTVEKKLLLQNFIKSNVPWILITHMGEASDNTDIVSDQFIHTAITNWCLPPWNWPTPKDEIWEFSPGGRSMALWHRDQIQDLI